MYSGTPDQLPNTAKLTNPLIRIPDPADDPNAIPHNPVALVVLSASAFLHIVSLNPVADTTTSPAAIAPLAELNEP